MAQPIKRSGLKETARGSVYTFWGTEKEAEEFDKKHGSTNYKSPALKKLEKEKALDNLKEVTAENERLKAMLAAQEQSVISEEAPAEEAPAEEAPKNKNRK